MARAISLKKETRIRKNQVSTSRNVFTTIVFLGQEDSIVMMKKKATTNSGGSQLHYRC